MGVRLTTPKQVLQALLDGHKLIHNNYGNGDETLYIYLSPAGWICEEDGATCKMSYLGDLTFRQDETWYEIVNK